VQSWIGGAVSTDGHDALAIGTAVVGAPPDHFEAILRVQSRQGFVKGEEIACRRRPTAATDGQRPKPDRALLDGDSEDTPKVTAGADDSGTDTMVSAVRH